MATTDLILAKDPYGLEADVEVMNPGEWVTFTLDEPLVIDHPGLVYVAHKREAADDPAVIFDNSTQKVAHPIR